MHLPLPSVKLLSKMRDKYGTFAAALHMIMMHARRGEFTFPHPV